MNTESSTPQLSFARRMGLAGRAFLKGVFILFLLVTVLGGVFYIAIALVYEQAVVPVRNNAQELDALKGRQAVLETRLNDDLSDYEARLSALESQRALDAEALSALQSELKLAQGQLQAHTTSLQQMTGIQSTLTVLQAAQTSSTAETAALRAKIARLQQQVQYLQALEALSRARLFLLQANYGRAEQEVSSAHQTLLTLQTSLPPADAQVLTPWLQRLELVMAELPDAPIVASEDLELAWQLIAAGLNPPGAQTAITPTSITTAIPSVTAAPTAISTP